MADWNEYFNKSRPPSNLDEAKRTIQDFAVKHRQLGRNIVLVTSGGTTVPIESNTVRFLDNFSQGTRGACSAEYFLSHGYAVIFLHRQRSFEPYCRHFEGQNALNLLDTEIDANGVYRVTVDEQRAPGLAEVVRRYKEVQSQCLLLKIGFLTLSDYLFLLRASAEALNALGNNVMFYLAAAVSDFYIPETDMHEHKIQSSDEGFSLHMMPTPKMMSPLVKEWAKNAFVVSFKLETDVNIISRKAREALQKYNHQVVIANILQTRRKTVVLVSAFDETPIWMSDHDIDMGKEIEEKIVVELARMHVQLINTSLDDSQQTSITNFNASQYQAQIGSSNLTNMPGLAPINVYNLNGSGKNVILQLKGNAASNDISAELVKQALPAKDDNSSLTMEMQRFIHDFKSRRVNLGYTQDDVGQELSRQNGPTYSQSFISRFEGKQLGMKAAERMRPILESWIRLKEEEHSRGNKFIKKRRKRTSFSPEYIKLLNEHFEKNPKPTPEEMEEIALKVNLDLNTVKVWYCNKKQSIKRQSHPGLVRHDLDVKRKRKAEADISDVMPFTQANLIKTVAVSTPTGTVNLPFFINHDVNSISLVSASQTSQTTNSLANNMDIPQIVHLSQLPILTSMGVMNTPLSSTDTHNQQISAARLISPIVQLQDGTLATAAQQNDVIIGETNESTALNNRTNNLHLLSSSITTGHPMLNNKNEDLKPELKTNSEKLDGQE